MTLASHHKITPAIEDAQNRLASVIIRTPLTRSENLSKRFDCNVFLKREDLQIVRSYKIRGAYNMMASLSKDDLVNGIVCASAGNHAQGVAYSCRTLGVKGIIFMPVTTPGQKVSQTKLFGEDAIDIKLAGDTFDECAQAAKEYAAIKRATFIPPFDDMRIIAGQGTIAAEIFEDLPNTDVVIIPVGGGGLCAGVGSWVKEHSVSTQIIGVEPRGAASMKAALDAGNPVTIDAIDRFVDGAAVKRVGEITYTICQHVIDEMQTVDEGRICSTILQLYNEEAIIAEPAGALSIAALTQNAERIRGKNVVCIVSGSNNDIERMQEIKERSLRYEGLKHYFLISFAQRPGALKEFVTNVLGPTDDITRFEYMQKTNKENGPALIGIVLQERSHYRRLIEKLHDAHIAFTEVHANDPLFAYLI